MWDGTGPNCKLSQRCIIGCSAAPLVCTHWMPMSSPPNSLLLVVKTEQHCQTAKFKTALVKNHSTNELVAKSYVTQYPPSISNENNINQRNKAFLVSRISEKPSHQDTQGPGSFWSPHKLLLPRQLSAFFCIHSQHQSSGSQVRSINTHVHTFAE